MIAKKRDGYEHSPVEIRQIVDTYTSGITPHEQMSAWLMAALLRGLTGDETAALTSCMLASGRRVSHAAHLRTGDKHSTGGIGDKTSLLIAPLVAACGGAVPMISGRGLGHTGGTLDKLESVPGFNVNLTLDQFVRQTEELGLCLIGQTREICPADGRIYALRDITGTVESIPLICASIVSKKVAEGASAIVYDVKWGSGAFMKTLDQAKNLSQRLIHLSQSMGLKATSRLTDTNAPLGQMAGNACEVRETLEILRAGKANSIFQEQTLQLSLDLSSSLLNLLFPDWQPEECQSRLQSVLQNGRALEKFEALIAAQGGRLNELPNAKHEYIYTSQTSGVFSFLDVSQVGLALIELGAGRNRQTDSIEPTAGIEFLAMAGSSVSRGQPLLRIFGADPERFAVAAQKIDKAVQVLSG